VNWAVATVRFACEIAAVTVLVWWGWPVLGILLAIATIVVWSAWVAPKAPRRLPDPMRLLVELVIFAVATAALVEVGQAVAAAIFAVAATGTALLSRRFPGP